jgi:hypothetical protein
MQYNYCANRVIIRNIALTRNCILLVVLSCVAIIANAQKKETFFYDANLYAAVDGWLVGPSVGISVGTRLAPEFSIIGSYNLFYSHGFRYNQNDFTNSFDISFSFQLLKEHTSIRGVYVGGGVAYQFRFFEFEHTYYNLITGAYHVGYGFPVKWNGKTRFMGIELKAYGPNQDGATLSQLMLGARLRF